MNRTQLKSLSLILCVAGIVYALLVLVAHADCVTHSDFAEPVYTWSRGCHSAVEESP